MIARTVLRWIEIENFRGFSAKQRIELAADVVILTGSNGMGKSSVIDALTWFITGQLPYLTERVKGLRRSGNLFANRYRDGDCRVRLCLQQGDIEQEFERTGSDRDSQLSIVDKTLPQGAAEEALAAAFGFTALDVLAEAYTSWGVLQQDNIRLSLDAGPHSMQRRLLAAVGMERINDFCSAAKQSVATLATSRKAVAGGVTQLQERITDLEAQLSVPVEESSPRASNVNKAVATLVLRARPGLEVSTPAAVGEDALISLGRSVGRCIEAAELLQETQLALRNASHNQPSQAMDLLIEQYESVSSQVLAAEETSTSAASLASAALPLLSNICPLCDQTIDVKDVTARLHAKLAAAKHSAELTKLRIQERGAREALDVARSALAERERARMKYDRQLSQFLQVALSAGITVSSDFLRDSTDGQLLASLQVLQIELRNLYADAFQGADATRLRLKGQKQALQKELDLAQMELEVIDARSERARSLSNESAQAAARILERALTNLEPSFAEVYDRIQPHPTFTHLAARQDTFYKKSQVVPEVRDLENCISAHPSLVLSEGQLNIVALSYFLGLALNARGGGMPFMVLDDPLQAMDNMTVLGFADVARRVSEGRQLVLTAHDKRHAGLLVRKLSPRSPGSTLLLHTFDAWTSAGPRVRTELVQSADVPHLLSSLAS